MVPTIELFCCYAREDQALLRHLKTHLMLLQRQGLITIWSDTDINAGVVWEEQIEQHLDSAHIILLLVSPDFMDSDYCYSNEMQQAMQRHERGEAHVIPIILRPTLWKEAPFSKLQALPTNAKPITDRSWHTEDEALLDVAEQISTVVKELRIQHALAEAKTFSIEQRYEEALVLYEQVVHLEPHSAAAHLGKGEVFLALERYEESLASFDKALQIDATNADVHFYERRAFVLSKLQRYKESLAVLDEAIRLNPLTTHSYSEKAHLLIQIRRYREALATYEQLIHLEPDKAEHFQHQGDLLLLFGRSTEALQAYIQASRLDPKIAIHYAQIGTLLASHKRYEEALDAYEQASQLEPMEAAYHQKRGELLLSLKRYEEAFRAYEEGIHTGANADPYSYYGKGQALFGLKRYEEAIVAYKEALRLDEDVADPQFYLDIGRVYECLAQQAYGKEQWAYLNWHSRRITDPLMIAARTEAFTLLHTLTSHTDKVLSLAFSRDGQVLASGSEDKSIKLWNWQTGEELRTLTGHRGYVRGLAFSRDGQVLASGSADKSIKLWNWQTGEELRTLTGHVDDIWELAFSPDGQVLASGSTDTTIKLWGIP